MKSFLIKYFFVLSLFYSLSLIAEEVSTQPSEASTTSEPSTDVLNVTNQKELTRLYNSPARVDEQSAWDIFISGSYLYWQPTENNLSYAIHNHLTNGVITSSNVKNLTFNYTSGGKVCIGTNIDHDKWISYIDYTTLYNTARSHISIPIENQATEYLSPIFWGTGTNISPNVHPLYGSGHWKLNYDMFNLVLGRPLYNSLKIILNTFYSIKGGVINQKYIATYSAVRGSETTTFTNKIISDSWLIGPRIGIDGSYFLGWDLKLIANCSATLAFQHLKVRSRENSYSVPATIIVNAERDYKQFIPVFEGAVGIGWGSYFCKKTLHVDVSATYDFNYYFHQNYMNVLRQEIQNSINSKAGDLALSGLTITAKFNF